MADANNIDKNGQIVQSACPAKMIRTALKAIVYNALNRDQYTFEWDQIICEAETEIYSKIRDFIIDESEMPDERS